MCIFRDCPIYHKCEQEVEQVLYCRHVEMIKKVAQLRLQLRQNNRAVQTDRIRVALKPHSEPTGVHH